MSSSQNISDSNNTDFNMEHMQYPPRAVGSGMNVGSSIGPTRRYIEDRQDRMRLTIQDAFFNKVKATSDAVKRLGMSIDSKTLPGLLSPGFAQRQLLRAGRPDAGPSIISGGEPSHQFPAPPSPFHTKLHEVPNLPSGPDGTLSSQEGLGPRLAQSREHPIRIQLNSPLQVDNRLANSQQNTQPDEQQHLPLLPPDAPQDSSNSLPNSQFDPDGTISSQEGQGVRIVQPREHPIRMQLDSPRQVDNQLVNSQQSTQPGEQQRLSLHLPPSAPQDGSSPLQNPQISPDVALSSQEGQDAHLAQSSKQPIRMLDTPSQVNNQLANSQQITQSEEQQHPCPPFLPTVPQDTSNPRPNSQPNSTDGQNPPLNQQLHQTAAPPQLESQQRPEGLPLFSRPFDFQEPHQLGAIFQPPNFETNPFLLQNCNPRRKVNTSSRRDSSSQGQTLGRRGRDLSPQAPTSKRQRRAHSAEVQISPSSRPPMPNGISPHVVLQIIEERDKRTRESFLNDMRLTVAETLRNTSSPAPTTTDTLTEDIVLKIIQPLLGPNLMAGTSQSQEDIDMNAPPASAREAAATLLAEIRKKGNVSPYPPPPNISSLHPSRSARESSSSIQATPSQCSPDQASKSHTDTDADDALPVSYKGARAKPTKRNAYHADIRSLLIAEKVRIPCTTRGVAPFRPQCPAPEDVQKYEDDQVGGPTEDRILIAWNQPLSSASPWNWDAITLLAHKAHQLLKESKNEYDRSWLELPNLQKSIVGCLRETKNIMKAPSIGSSSKRLSSRSRVAENSLPRNRRRARKTSKVASRHNIVEENEHRDPQLWTAAREVVDAVGVDGMSGEDTDVEAPGREKRLLRVPVKWINSELTGLFHAIDTWKSAIQDETFSALRGNRPLTRLATSKDPIEGHATKGLPRNWYDDTWYKSQSNAKKILLNALPPRPIPCLQPRQ